MKERRVGIAFRCIAQALQSILALIVWIPASLLMFLGVASVFVGLALGIVALFTGGLTHAAVHAEVWASLGLIVAGILICVLAQCGLACLSQTRSVVRRER